MTVDRRWHGSSISIALLLRLEHIFRERALYGFGEEVSLSVLAVEAP
jgi:hypothetical protein